jgi:anti-anti-sigma regulatory factor
MPLFPKLPARKHTASKPDPNSGRDANPASGAPAAAGGGAGYRPAKPSGGITITGFGLVEASPTRRVIEVTHGNAGMCAVLENAVLLYASGHADAARALLAEGVESDPEAQVSPLAWLALFDLLQRAGDRAGFEHLALQYVVRFERSAPAWNDRLRPAVHPRAQVGGYIGVTGKLTAASATQLDALKRAIAGNVSQARFDLAAITDFDEAGARLLADVLGEARRMQYPLGLQRQDGLRRALEAAVRKGQAGGEGAWLLSLELLQWQGDRAAFDDRAVDYAVTFEVSPPSWEPPVLAGDSAPQIAFVGEAAAAEGEATDGAGTAEALALSGVVAGPHPAQVAKLIGFADGRAVLPVDMSEVERVDFVGAGAVYNAIKSIEEHRKSVQLFGATPMIRAMLLLIGVPSGHFYKKAN